jgi:hypothetical protein
MGIELVQESPKFLMTMPRETRAHDGAFEDIERRKQRRGAVSLVVMRHRAGAAAFHRQPRRAAKRRRTTRLQATGEMPGTQSTQYVRSSR